MELATNILNIFFCFSNFSFFHQIITQNKIGDACLRIADQEFQRFDLWMEELNNTEGASRLADLKDAYSLATSEIKKIQLMIKKQDQLLFGMPLTIIRRVNSISVLSFVAKLGRRFHHRDQNDQTGHHHLPHQTP